MKSRDMEICTKTNLWDGELTINKGDVAHRVFRSNEQVRFLQAALLKKPDEVADGICLGFCILRLSQYVARGSLHTGKLFLLNLTMSQQYL